MDYTSCAEAAVVQAAVVGGGYEPVEVRHLG